MAEGTSQTSQTLPSVKACTLDESQSQRPPETKFLQQKFPTYYPVLNAGFIYPIFFVFSIIFMLTGVGWYFYSESIEETQLPYANCRSHFNPNITCEQILDDSVARRKGLYGPSARQTVEPWDCECRVDFAIERPMNGTVYIYYSLTNYYQSHLRYYTSRDENQLKGDIGEIQKDQDYTKVSKQPSSFCDPYDYDDIGRIIIPCGMQANSMFFDRFKLYHWYDGEDHLVPLLRTGIAWESDKKKFNNPEKLRNIKDPIWNFFAKPPDWKVNLAMLDPENPENNGMKNEDFIVWMKTAAFPNFRKLHRIVDKQGLYTEGLPVGNYSFIIDYNTRVSYFDGSKTVILTNSKETAGKNYFLAAAFLATGVILFILFVIFLLIHFYTRNRYLTLK